MIYIVIDGFVGVLPLNRFGQTDMPGLYDQPWLESGPTWKYETFFFGFCWAAPGDP